MSPLLYLAHRNTANGSGFGKPYKGSVITAEVGFHLYFRWVLFVSFRSGSRGRDGLDIKDSAKEVLDDLGLSLLSGFLNLLDLLLGLLVRLVLGLLITLAVLFGG
jgi:hypothetical protein